MSHVSAGPWGPHREQTPNRQTQALGGSLLGDSPGDRAPARTHGPQGRPSPRWLVKSVETKAEGECRRARAPSTLSCSHPHFLWPRHPPRTQAAEPSRPTSCTNHFRERTLSRSQPPNQYIERPEKRLLYLPTAFENPDHALDLATLASTMDAPHSARLPPRLLCQFFLLPLKHRCAEGPSLHGLLLNSTQPPNSIARDSLDSMLVGTSFRCTACTLPAGPKQRSYGNPVLHHTQPSRPRQTNGAAPSLYSSAISARHPDSNASCSGIPPLLGFPQSQQMVQIRALLPKPVPILAVKSLSPPGLVPQRASPWVSLPTASL